MAINKVVNKSTKSHGAMKNVIGYVLRDDKVKEGYVEITGPYTAAEINTNDIYQSWLEEKRLWDKDSGRMYAHNIISFHKEEQVSPSQVLDIGKDFADKFFSGHQSLIGVHQDKNHLHCHIVTNSVSYIDGHKLHQTKKDLKKQKEYTNLLCSERGLTVTEKGHRFDGTLIEEGEIKAEKQIKEESSRINSLADSKIAALKDHLMKEYHTKMEEQQYNYTQRMRKLDTEYRVKSNSLHSLIIGSSLYGLFVTLLTALKSPRCCQDIEEAYTFIYDFFSDILEKSIILALYGWSIKESIPYDVINVLVPGLLAVLGFIFLPAILLLVLFGIYKLGKIYKENFADLISVLVALASLAVLVWFADQLSFISWNLVIVFLLIHLMYLIVRILLDSNDCF